MMRLIFIFVLLINSAFANDSLTQQVAQASNQIMSELSASPAVTLNDENNSSFIIDQIWFQLTPNVSFQLPGAIVQLTVTPVVELFFKKKLPSGYVLYTP